MAESTSSSNSIYHERQSWQLCAMHSLNNLFQGVAFTRDSLDDICKKLSPESGFWNPHKNCIGLGNYDVNVVISALNTKDCTAVWFDKRKSPEVIDLTKIVGFIANVPSQAKISFVTIPFIKRNHWIAMREINGTYYNLDSKLAAPELIGGVENLVQYLKGILSCKDKELFVIVNCETEKNGSWNKEKK
uniref:Josephin-2 n=1 Tax=Romanomermis culicivorax TaxID=13658 RepID=A0A915IGN3_ROMCU